jgi:hypothetical protein
MLRSLFASVAALMVLVLSSCTSALNDENACIEVSKFSGELSDTLEKMTDNLDNPPSLATFSSRLVGIADEVGELNIASEELSSTVKSWSSNARELGIFFSSFELGDDTAEIIPAYDQWTIAHNTIQRLCG